MARTIRHAEYSVGNFARTAVAVRGAAGSLIPNPQNGSCLGSRLSARRSYYSAQVESRYNRWRMDELDDIARRTRIAKLQARLALREIERDKLSREIYSRRTDPQHRVEAIERRDSLTSELADITAELASVTNSAL